MCRKRPTHAELRLIILTSFLSGVISKFAACFMEQQEKIWVLFKMHANKPWVGQGSESGGFLRSAIDSHSESVFCLSISFAINALNTFRKGFIVQILGKIYQGDMCVCVGGGGVNLLFG